MPEKPATVPAPAPADLPACWECGYEFTRQDTGEERRHDGEFYRGRTVDRICEPHPVPFLGLILCDHCHRWHAKHVNRPGPVVHVDAETGVTFRATWPRESGGRYREKSPPRVSLTFESEAAALSRVRLIQPGARVLIDPPPAEYWQGRSRGIDDIAWRNRRDTFFAG